MQIKLGRNDPCPCGSGKKYSKCCLGQRPPPAPEPEGYRVPRSEPKPHADEVRSAPPPPGWSARSAGNATSHPAGWHVAMERALLKQVQHAWGAYNQSHFEEQLRPPVLELVDSAKVLGRWQLTTRTLALSRPLLLERPWGAVVEVIKHEMAHQFVHEVLRITDEAAHGKAFQSVCSGRGIDPRAYGLPDDTGEDDRTRLLRKVHKLLALAGSSNAYEAEAAMQQAQRLMLEHNLHAQQGNAAHDYRVLQLGEPTQRLGAHVKLLGSVLSRHFFVQVIIVPSYQVATGLEGHLLEVCGRPENVAMAQYVYDFLLATGERLWEQHRRDHDIWGHRDRRVFLVGVMEGFLHKLEAQREQTASVGLVWVGDSDLEALHERRYPRVRKSRVTVRTAEALHHGREAGKGITVHKPVERGAAAHGRLLAGRP